MRSLTPIAIGLALLLPAAVAACGVADDVGACGVADVGVDGGHEARGACETAPTTSSGTGASGLALSVDFTRATAGCATMLPSWLSGSRSSARYVQTSASTLASSTVESGSLAIGQPGGAATKGLLVERSATNIYGRPLVYTCPPWASAGTFTGGQAGPDGNDSAYHVEESVGWGYVLQTFTPSALPYQLSVWMKQGASAAWDSYFDMGGTVASAGGASVLSSTWARYAYGYTVPAGAAGIATSVDIGDASGLGTGTARALDLYSQFPQLEQAPYPTTFANGARAPERLYSPRASDVVFGGRLAVEIAFTPTWGTSQLGQRGDVHRDRALWTLDPYDLCQLDGTHRQIRCVVGGTPSVFPTIVSWNALDQIVLHLEAGNGAPRGWYTRNGGSQVSLGSDGAVHPYLRTEDAALDWACDATSGTPGTPASQLDATIQSIEVFEKGSGEPGTTYYASASGSGSTCSKALPCSLTGAQAKARGAGATVLLRAGTYRLGSTFALTASDSGTAYQLYPRDGAAILSGAALLGCAWSVDAGSVYKCTGVPLPVEQLYVNGVRGQRGARRVTDAGSWSIDAGAGTFTASDATIAGFARPTDVRIHLVGTFSYGLIPLSAVAGTTLTAKSTAFANALSVCERFGCTIPPRFIAYYDNARELCENWGDWYWNRATRALYYHARPSDAGMTGAVAEVASLNNVVTIAGAKGAPASSISLRGLTIEGSDWHGSSSPSSAGYASVGSGATGSYTSPGDYPASSYDEQPAAISVSYASGIRLAGLTVRRTAAAGIAFRAGTQHSTVEGSTITDTAGNGGFEGELANAFSSGGDAGAYVTGNTWRRNRFASTGSCPTCYVDSGALALGYTASTTITQNTIANTGLVGVSASCPATPSPTSIRDKETVSGNLISGVCDGFGAWQVACDAGFVHTGGPNATGSTISGNCGARVPGVGVANVFLYIDNLSSLWTVTGNVHDEPTGSEAFWLVVQGDTGLESAGNTIRGNYALATELENDGIPGHDTISGNTLATPLGTTALGICARAGMSIAGGLHADDDGIGVVVALAAMAVVRRRRRRRTAGG